MATHLRITGLVQGVGYRASFAARAQSMGLSGWVKNRRDGSVEAAVCGPSATVKQLVDWAWQGPPTAHVKSVEITERSDTDDAGAIGKTGGVVVLPTD